MSGGPPASEAVLPRGRRVVVAMSGGVDSSVAAALLREAGNEVVGVTLRLQDCSRARASRSCCGADGITRARAVAGQLGISHYVLDGVREFECEVLRPAWSEYAAGRTPSPCLPCNERIKFGLLLEWARRLGAEYLATGHYARVARSADGGPALLRGRDPHKDQSYFLAGLDREQLAAALFPVGHLSKSAVRGLARARGLCAAETRDSQNACLVEPGRSFAEMLRERFSGVSRAGPILDDTGTVLGRHAGIHRFTVGQRRGLGLSSTGRRWVKEVRAAEGAVVVTEREDALLSRRLAATGMRWLVPRPPAGRVLECEVQLRYRGAVTAAAVACGANGAVAIELREPVRAVAPGQAAVLYDGERVLGRGWIDAA